MNVLHSILTDVWCIEQNWLDGNMMNVVRLLKGESNIFQQTEDKNPVCTLYNVENGSEVDINEQRVGNTGDKYVAIFNVSGPLSKYDQPCGPSGTMTLNRAITQASKDDDVIAAVFLTDSPGGQASFIHTVATSVQNFGKPTFTSVTGMAASAAYYIAAATDKIYCQEEMDLIGSIGTMMTIADMKSYFEKQGLKIHDIFADQSENKNSLIAQAMSGDYQPLKDKILNPNAEQFINFVKSNREITEKTAFEGSIFLSKEAKKYGLIDGVKGFEAVLEEAYELGIKQYNQNQKIKNSLNMKNENILQEAANKLGFEALEAKDGYVSLTVEQLGKLTAKETATPVAAEKVDNSALEALTAKVNALETKTTVLEKGISENKAAIKAYGEDTTVTATTGAAQEDPANKNISTKNEEKPLTEMEKYGDTMANYGITE